MKSQLFLIAFLTLMAPGLSASVPMSIGERGSIVVPFYNNAGSLVPVEGVKITATANVPGLNILSTSFLGPVSVFPGRTAYFHVDFEIGSGYNLNNQSAEIVIDLLHTTSNFLPASRRWVYKTQNLFRTLRADCQEPGDIYCGEYVSPDTDSPTTEIVFDGTEYIDNAGSVYVSANTLISFIGGDKYVADSDISGVAITAYKIGAQPSGFEALTPITDPISLSAGNNVLYFASRDYKGNTEAIKSKSVVVDVAAPGAPGYPKADGKKDASPWKNVKKYTLSWTNPSEVAGIAGARVKFGAGKPNFNSDGVLFVGVDSIIYPTPDIGEGPAPIWLWLEDNVGNANPGNAEMLTLYYDGIDPFSSASSPEYSNTNVVAVAFAASDEGSLGENPTGSGVKETVLWHRHNDGAWSAGETKTGLNGTFNYNTQGALGTWEFYTQAFDMAGRSEPSPGGEVKAKTDTFVDITAPIISGLSATAFSPDTAVLEWTTDDETTAVIDYSRTTTTQGPVQVGQYNETKLGRIHRVTITGLPNPAEINFNVTAKNRTGLTTAGQKSCNMPLNVSYETDLFGVIDYSQPVKVYVTNPEITQASLMVNGSVWSGPVGPGLPATLPVDPVTTGGGSHELHASAGGYEYASSVVVDAAVRTVKLVRLVISAGGAMNPDGESAATAGQAAQQEMAAPGGGSKLYPGYYAGIDPKAPGAISDLNAIAGPEAGKMTLRWTAPGDDGDKGTAMKYEIRYSPASIPPENFGAAALVPGVQLPKIAGTADEAVITGLADGTLYYFMVKTYDELLNSSLSNEKYATTREVARSAEVIDGKPAVEVISSVAGLTIEQVPAASGNPAFAVAGSQGLVFYSALFEISPSMTFPEGETALVHFRYVDPGAQIEAGLAVYKYNPALGQWVEVQSVVDTGNNIIRAVTNSFSLYAVFGKDTTPPVTTASLVDSVRYTDQAGNVYISSAAKVSLTAADPGSSGGVARIEYRLDSSNAPYQVYNAPLPFADGWHSFQYRSVDVGGNIETAKGLFVMKDALAPRVEMNFDRDFTRLPSGIIHISSTNAELEVSVFDQPSSGSGLRSLRFELDGAEVQGQAAPLDMGRHSVVIRAEDNVGNVAEQRTEIVVGDLLPPIITAPANKYSADGATVTFSWQHQTTNFFSLTEYDLMLGGEPGFGEPEFTKVVSSHVKVTVLISELGVSVQGLEEISGGGFRLITEFQESDNWTGALEGVIVTPNIYLPHNTTGITSFTVTQSTNAGTIAHEVSVAAPPFLPGAYSPIAPGASLSLDLRSGGLISFRSTLRRGAYSDESPTLTKIEFVVNYVVPYYNNYYHKHCTWGCSWHWHYESGTTPYSYQTSVSAASGISHEGLRISSGAVELITEHGALTGVWLSQVYPIPEGAYRAGDFLKDYDTNGGTLVFEFSKSGADFKPIAGLDYEKFKESDTLQLKVVLGRATSEDPSPVFRGISFNFIAPPPTETDFILPGERKYYWRVVAKDFLGRFSAPSEERLLYYDTKPPLTEHLLAGATGQNGWYIAPVAAAFASTDAVAGIGGTYYSVGNSSFTLYDSSFTLNTEGTSLLRYYSEDEAHNREAEQSFTAKIDLSSPTITATVTPSPNADGWNNGPVGVVFIGSDTVSGLAYCTSSATVSGESAVQLVSGACFDNAGLSSTRAVSVSIDTTPPSIAYSSAPWPNEFGWNSSTVTLAFACADALSGIRTCPASVAFTLEGVNISTSVGALDKAGNLKMLSAGGIKIDRMPPVSSATLAGTIRNNWYSSPVAVTLTSTDALSGARQTMHSADGAAFAAYQQALNLSADGPHVVKYYALDKAGNTEAVQTASLSIDRTAPQVGYTIMPPPNQDGWNKGPVNVIFNGTDTLSGMEICSQIFVSTEGPQQAAGWCRDRAGNQGYSTAPVKIDLTSPTVSALASPPANGRGWNNTAVTVVFSGYDTLSGDPNCMGGGTVTDEGAGQIVSGSCMNKAGLVSYAGLVVSVDKTAPVLSISTPAAGQIFIATRGDIGVKFAITDNLDPAPAYVAWLEQVEDRGSPRGARPARLAVANGQSIEPLDIDDGSWRLIVSATDFADNAAQLTGGVFEVIHDVLAPRTGQTITAGPSLTVGTTTYITSAARLELTSIDDLVSANDGIGLGVKDQSIRVKSGGSLVKELLFANPSPKQGEAFISTVTGAGLGVADGSYNLAYNASDVLGNIEIEKSVLIGLDNTAPASSAGLAGTAGGNGWHISTVTINLTATDALSGVAGISYGLDSGAYLAYTNPVETATEGQRTVRFYARDRLGNTEAGKSVDFKIDRTAPAIVPERSPAANVHGWNKTGVTVSFTCSDAVSGVQLCPAEAAFSIEGFGQAVSGTVRDYAGHASSASVGGINIDKTAPAGSLSVTGELWESGSDKYLNPRSAIALAATDGLSGVEAMEYRVDEAPFGVYSSSFSLAEGMRAVHYRAIDKADNIEATRTALYRVDGTGPATFLKAVGGSWYSGPEPGSFYASLASRFTLEAADPVTNGVASGVRQTFWSDNGGAASNTTESLAFAEGRHVLAYWSIDNVYNQEVTKSTTILVDNTAPVTTHNIGSPYYAVGGVNYITPATPLTFTASDPVSGEVTSGVIRIEVSLNGSSFGAYSSVLKFAEGRHTIKYRAVDNVGNVEAEKTLEVQSDNTVPVSGFVSSGQYYESLGKSFVPLRFTYSLTAADPVVGNVASGVKFSEYRIGGGAFIVYSSTFGLTEGIRYIEYRSHDNVTNTEPLKSATVYVDNTVPKTALRIAGGAQYVGPEPGSFYSSLASRFTLEAADPVTNSVASGVRQTFWSDNGGAISNAIEGLAFAEGRHVLSYGSIDNVDNLEVTRSTTILVDNTAPVTTHNIGSPYYAAGGVNYITPATPLTFTAADPVSGEVASGVSRIEVSLDGSLFGAYGSALKFNEGRHTIKYRAIDNIGNVEAERIIEVQSDNTAPISNWSASSGDRIERGNKFYLNALGRIALGSVDPVISDVASGVEGIYYGIDAMPTKKYAAPVGLAEGVRTIKFSAKDSVGNTEVVKSTVIYVDGTKPVTELSISGDQYKSDRQYISRRTDIVIAAADPVVEAVSVGVKETKYAVDGRAFSDYSQFKLGVEGRRLVSFYSADYVNNMEAQKTAELWVDGTAPLSVLDFLGGKQYPDAEPGSFYASQTTRLGFVSMDPIVSDGAAGVKAIEYADNGGISAVYAQPISLGEGKHLITYRATDRVENIEVFRSTRIYIDNTAPVTSFTIAGPLYINAGIRHITPVSELTFTSADPLVSEVSAGVERIETAVDGGQWLKYTQTLKFSEGRHTVKYRAIDNVGNIEAERVLEVRSDATPPVTAQHIGAPYYVSGAGVNYITPDTPLTFNANDPVTSEVASGVERIETSIDGGAYALYTIALKFPEGKHTIKYRAYDNVGNLEAAHMLEVQSDSTPPESRWLPANGPWIEKDNKFYLNAIGSIALESADPVRNNVAAGMENIYYGIDTAPAVKYLAAFSLSEGVRMLNYSAKDNVGNTEIAKSTVIYVDGTKPVSELSVSGDQYKSDRQYISRRTDIVIAATDPVISDVSVGVKETKYAVDGGSYNDYSLFKLSVEGKRLVYFYSVDHVNNVEVAKTAELWVDGTAPLSVLNVLGGKQSPGAEPGSFYASLETKFGFIAMDPVVSDGAAGVKAIEYADNGGIFAVYAQPISLGEGKHLMTYRATDQVENTEVFRSTQIYIDNTAPVTSFNIAGPLYLKDGVRHITPESGLAFTSVDPLVSEVSAGVERIETAVDGGQWLKYTQALKFAEGRHTIKYRAIDNVGNTEAERILELRSDATPPVTAQHIGAPYYVSGAGVNYITPDTPLTFSANDPVTSEVASGVERIETSIDGGAYALYTAALKFPEGRHTIKYRAYDNVGNLEAAQALEVQSDSTAPESRWLPASGPWIEKDNKFYLNAIGSIALESADPVRNNVAAGLENIYYGIDAAPAIKYTAAFSLAEGVRTVNYSAKDNLGNTELVKSTVAYVDGTKPVTGLSLSGDQYNGDKQYISQRTDIVITAADPVVNNVAVGVKHTKYSVDGAAFANYSLFKLSAEGKRLVSYYSTDFVSNIETAKTTALWVDNTPPSTELSIAGARYTASGDDKLYVTRDSGIVLTSSDPVSNDTASGVMLTKYRIDNGNWLVYSGSFTIAAEGLHTLEYYALDRVQNVEALSFAKIAVDNTPPATAISLGEPKSEVFGLPVLMQNTPVTLTAADPVVNSISAGLNSIFYELENAQTGVRSLVTAYTSPFTITEQGTFIIRYWSKDNTGNIETHKEKMAAVTTWQADGLIAASGLDMSGTADISGSVKSNAIVSLGGNARILGDVTASTITLTGKAQITGLQISGAVPVNPAPIYLAGIVQNAAAVNNNALVSAYLVDGKLALSSKLNITLSTGTYYFKGMDLSGGSSITISGKVDILVEGGITINGGSSLNATGEASRLSIIVSTASELKFNGGGALAACVYAPYSDLKLAGNALLGGHYFVKSAAVSGTGNLLQSGEALPVLAATTGGGTKTKAAAMPGSRVGVLAGPDPEFRLGEVYVFPNPAKGTEAPVFHIETGIADSVKITIYTISGRVAHEYTLTGFPVELDDGNGLSYAYEYTWRGHIPSGIYLYSIEARKAGQTLKKTGKFGVIR